MTMSILAGFRDSADVRLGSVIFNAYDRNGVAWVLTDLDGWWDLPDVSIPDDPRPYEQDGSYFAPGRYLPRVIAVSGTLVPPGGVQQTTPLGNPTPNLAAYARHALAAALDITRRQAVLKVDEETPKQAAVQLASKPTFKNSRINGATDFMIQLKSADPRKYSQVETQLDAVGLARSGEGRHYPRTYPLTYMADPDNPTPVSNGISLAENIGTYNTGAIIRIYGPISTPRVENIEQDVFLQLDVDVADGDYLEIDLMNRSVLLNGITNRRHVLDVRSRWFMLEPGKNSLRFNGEPLGSSGEPRMSVTFRSAWLY